MRVRSSGREVGCAYRRGFTLAELLVVVSIICLLMSVLLPSLNRAQKQGEQIHCLANQHQLFLAWLLYAGDSDDRLCSPQGYPRALGPYTNSEAVFLCKTVADTGRQRCYGVSNTMGGESRDGVEPYIRLHTVSHVSEKLVFVDKEVESSASYWPILRNEGTWTWRPWSWPPGLQGMTSRHGNGCNMTYADGHGERTHWMDDRTVKLIKGLIADPAEGTDSNPDLDHMVRILAANRTAPRDPNESGGSGGRRE